MTDKLEVHAVLDIHEARRDLLLELEDAIDLASDQDRETELLRDGKHVASVVPVEQAVRGRVPAEPRLDALADKLLALVQAPVLPRGQEITLERWERKVKGVIAEIFRLGMGIGWDKHADAVRDRLDAGDAYAQQNKEVHTENLRLRDEVTDLRGRLGDA